MYDYSIKTDESGSIQVVITSTTTNKVVGFPSYPGSMSLALAYIAMFADVQRPERTRCTDEVDDSEITMEIAS